MAQDLLWYLHRAQDLFGVPRTSYADFPNDEDEIYGDTMLVEDIWEGVKEVVRDLARKKMWDQRSDIETHFISGRQEYPLPSNCAIPYKISFRFGGVWRPVLDIGPMDTMEDYRLEDLQTPYPTEAAWRLNQGRPVHKNGYVTASWAGSYNLQAAGGFPPTLDDRTTSFGVTLSGKEIDQGDSVYNLTDGSFGTVHYLGTVSNWLVGQGSTVTADSVTATELNDTSVNFTTSNVLPGHIIALNDGDGNYDSWAIVRKVANGKLTINDNGIVHGKLNSLQRAQLSDYKVGIPNRIFLITDNIIQDLDLAERPIEGLTSGGENDFDLTLQFAVSATNRAQVELDLNAATLTTTITTEFSNNNITLSSDSTITVVTSGTEWIVNSNNVPYVVKDETNLNVYLGDQFQIESQWEELDVIRFNPIPNLSDTLGNPSMRLFYYRYPIRPTQAYHRIALPDTYHTPILARVEELVDRRRNNRMEISYEAGMNRAMSQRRPLNTGAIGNKYGKRRYPHRAMTYASVTVPSGRGV